MGERQGNGLEVNSELYVLSDVSCIHSGIVLFAAGSTSTAIALTWAGVQYAWDTTPVLVPLILGLVTLLACYIYEAKFAKNPVVSIIANLLHGRV
jgi:RsiW-degrading membrane proteinase PrsW (M82 family)